LENLNSVHAFDPLQWRIHVGAGVRTASIHRLARENGLFFPPDPGAAEQSQIGGNVATNAGGPHAFKYGVTGAWVTGLEVVFPPGNLVRIGGPLRKDVAGYDLRSLIVGSEGTLAIITSVWLRLLPAPALALPVAAFFTDAEAGCAAIERVFGYGLTPATLEYFEGQALMIAQRGLPFQIPDETTFLVLSEADGRPDAARELQHELREALGEDALDVWAPQDGPATDGLQRWRDGVSLAVAAARGGKRSEDISVPVDRIRDAITRTLEIGKRFDLPACSWGHAGDGNLHCTFMIDPSNEEERQRAEAAAAEVLTTALDLGGSISGEHGVGQMKRKAHINSTEKHKLELYRALKLTFDPKGLLNPDKKV
jgi:FAD/FMN-containing dehydrogenase